MPYKDPDQARTYHREYARQKRAGEVKPFVQPQTPADFEQALEIGSLLSETLAEVRAWEGDTLQKARCLAYVAAVALKAAESGSIERRLQQLEESLEAEQ